MSEFCRKPTWKSWKREGLAGQTAGTNELTRDVPPDSGADDNDFKDRFLAFYLRHFPEGGATDRIGDARFCKQFCRFYTSYRATASVAFLPAAICEIVARYRRWHARRLSSPCVR